MAFPHKREKIAETIKGWLDAGKYAPGDRFPSDQELARRFHVTHVTVRSALRPFVESGVLERRIGSGTLVRAAGTAVAVGALANAVGVTIPDNTYSFFNEILKAIEAALYPTRRPLLLGHTWELGDREDTIVRGWREQGLQRLLLVPTPGHAEVYQRLADEGARVVFVDREVPGIDLPSVTSRDREGARLLTRLLLEPGARRIVHLAGTRGASTAEARIAGFVDACTSAGVPQPAKAVIPAGFFLEDGYRATRELLTRGGPPPEVIFAANDPVAVGALRALAERGLDVPRDVRLAGYGDTDLGRNFQLTTVRQFPERMGAEAVRLLLAPRPPRAADSLVIEPEIVVRASTAGR